MRQELQEQPEERPAALPFVAVAKQAQTVRVLPDAALADAALAALVLAPAALQAQGS